MNRLKKRKIQTEEPEIIIPPPPLNKNEVQFLENINKNLPAPSKTLQKPSQDWKRILKITLFSFLATFKGFFDALVPYVFLILGLSFSSDIRPEFSSLRNAALDYGTVIIIILWIFFFIVNFNRLRK